MNEKVAYYFRERYQTISECFESGRVLPGLTLLYSGIDGMAWLGLPRTQEDVSGNDFVAWVDRYMLSGSTPPYNARDLYAARCAVLHTYTAVSRLSRQGQAKKLQYFFGDVDPVWVESHMTEEARRTSIVVPLSDLLELFEAGVERFTKQADTDPELGARVNERARQLYLAM